MSKEWIKGIPPRGERVQCMSVLYGEYEYYEGRWHRIWSDTHSQIIGGLLGFESIPTHWRTLTPTGQDDE